MPFRKVNPKDETERAIKNDEELKSLIDNERRNICCKINGCYLYDKNNNNCTRVGQIGVNKGKYGVCWMDKSEGEY